MELHYGGPSVSSDGWHEYVNSMEYEKQEARYGFAE